MSRLASALWDDAMETITVQDIDWCSKSQTPSRIGSISQAPGTALLQEREILQERIRLLTEQLDTFSWSSGKLPELVSSYAAWRPASPWDWLASITETVRSLPRLQDELRPALEATNFSNGEIVFNLVNQGKHQALSGKILEHCEVVTRSLSFRGPCIFKIGITENPVSRWCVRKYAYKNDAIEKWQGMVVLHMDSDSFVCGLIEAHLIRVFRETPGCRNTAHGGESLSPLPGPHCVYVVFRSLVPPGRK